MACSLAAEQDAKGAARVALSTSTACARARMKGMCATMCVACLSPSVSLCCDSAACSADQHVSGAAVAWGDRRLQWLGRRTARHAGAALAGPVCCSSLDVLRRPLLVCLSDGPCGGAVCRLLLTDDQLRSVSTRQAGTLGCLPGIDQQRTGSATDRAVTACLSSWLQWCPAGV